MHSSPPPYRSKKEVEKTEEEILMEKINQELTDMGLPEDPTQDTWSNLL